MAKKKAKSKKAAGKKAKGKAKAKKPAKKKKQTGPSMAGAIKALILKKPSITAAEIRPKIEKDFGKTAAFQNHFTRYVYNCRVALANAGKIPALKKSGGAKKKSKKSKSKKTGSKKTGSKKTGTRKAG